MVRTKNDKYGEVVRLNADTGPPFLYAVIWPDGSLEEFENPTYPPTRLGYWCIVDWNLSRDEVTEEYSAFIDIIDVADRSIVHHFEQPLKVKSRGYAVGHGWQAVYKAVEQLGYFKIVEEDSITWEAVR